MFCFELEFEDDNNCYIDGHNKQIWHKESIPTLFLDILAEVKAYLTNIKITLKKDQEVQLLTYNDTKHQKAMLEFIKAFSKSTGKVITKAAVFDRSHLIMTVMNNFSRLKKVFTCTLKPEEYKGIKDFDIVNDFTLLKKYEPYANVTLFNTGGTEPTDTLEWVADTRYTLRDRSLNQTVHARAALVVKFCNLKASIIPILTNIDQSVNVSKVALNFLEKNKPQDNLFVRIVKTIEDNEEMASQEQRSSGRRSMSPQNKGGKQGVSIRPKNYEEPVIPPYARSRSMADDITIRRK